MPFSGLIKNFLDATGQVLFQPKIFLLRCFVVTLLFLGILKLESCNFRLWFLGGLKKNLMIDNFFKYFLKYLSHYYAEDMRRNLCYIIFLNMSMEEE